MLRGFPTINPSEGWNFLVNSILRSTRLGKLNCVGEVTLRASETTTTITDELVGLDSFIGLMPVTANALTAQADIYFDAPARGSVVVNHASDAATDQTFRYIVIG